MTVLITGGAGFVGLALAEQLLARGTAVTIADRNPLPEIARAIAADLPGTLRVAPLDVTDRASIDTVFKTAQPTHLIHLAAITAGVDRDASDPRSIALVNYVGTIDVLSAAREHGVARVVYASTGALFGQAGFNVDHRLDEINDRPVPQTLYGITKYAAERTALRLRDLWKLDLVVGRLAMVYGRWEYPTGVRDTLSPLWKITRMALRGEPVVFPDSGPIDWIYSIDVARALMALLDTPQAQLKNSVYHLGVGNPWSIRAWCEQLKARIPGFEYRLSPNENEWKVPGISATMRTPFAANRLRDDTGFVEAFTMTKAMDDYWAWIAQHRQSLDL